ncbi:hypothetical protein CP533_0434 [Ophiocordyceps camponoti-saundersi (nom. inval.)]|nr:hypothetical protein CP533_0434 [Ophiocordyceps camponoti-saundersi (nom. inval.)]
MLLAAFLTICAFSPRHGFGDEIYPADGIVRVLHGTSADKGSMWARRIADTMIASHTSHHQQPYLEGTWASLVDVMRPPVSETWITEPTCWRNWFTCGHVTFTRRSELINDPFPQQFVSLLSDLPPVSYEPRAKIFATKHLDYEQINHYNQSITVSTHQSTQELKSANVWQVEANLEEDGVIHLHRGKPSGATTTTTKVVETVECPPGKTCSFETWTIHATFVGYCRRRPTIQCGQGPKEICFPINPGRSSNELEGPLRIHEWADCEQFNQFVWNECYKNAADKFLGPTAEDCEMTAPILYDGRPLSAVISWQIPSES